MNVKQLKQILEPLDDDLELVLTAPDHRYCPVNDVSLSLVAEDMQGYYEPDAFEGGIHRWVLIIR